MFRACSVNQCTFNGDLCSTKSYLDFIDNNTIKFLPSGKNNYNIPLQQTTLKWNSTGSLSCLELARILGCLEKTNLLNVNFFCQWSTNSNNEH